MKAGTRRAGLLRPLAERDFRLLWGGQAISLVGDGVLTVALAWQTLRLSSSPLPEARLPSGTRRIFLGGKEVARSRALAGLRSDEGATREASAQSGGGPPTFEQRRRS